MSAPLLFATMNALESIPGSHLPPTHRLVLLVLADAADAAGQEWLSADRIALRIGATRRTVENCLPELAAAGWIEEKGKRHRAILYAVAGIAWEERAGENGRREVVVTAITGRAIVIARGGVKSEPRSEDRASSPNYVRSEVRTTFGGQGLKSERRSDDADAKSEPRSEVVAAKSERRSSKSERRSTNSEPRSDNPILDPIKDPKHSHAGVCEANPEAVNGEASPGPEEPTSAPRERTIELDAAPRAAPPSVPADLENLIRDVIAEGSDFGQGIEKRLARCWKLTDPQLSTLRDMLAERARKAARRGSKSHAGDRPDATPEELAVVEIYLAGLKRHLRVDRPSQDRDVRQAGRVITAAQRAADHAAGLANGRWSPTWRDVAEHWIAAYLRVVDPRLVQQGYPLALLVDRIDPADLPRAPRQDVAASLVAQAAEPPTMTREEIRANAAQFTASQRAEPPRTGPALRPGLRAAGAS